MNAEKRAKALSDSIHDAMTGANGDDLSLEDRRVILGVIQQIVTEAQIVVCTAMLSGEDVQVTP